MASGRVGGTRSLKSGKVGDEVLSVTANGDGTYSQQVSAYVPSKQQTKTVKLACEQMATAMVEAMMRDLKPIGKVGFQSAANKSKSLNAFSSWNLYKVQNEMKNSWYEWNEFMFVDKGGQLKLGGTWILSSGTLRYNCFGGFCGGSFHDTWIDEWPRDGFSTLGVWWEWSDNDQTIGDFMKRYNLQYNTEIWLAVFWMNQDYDDKNYYTWLHVVLDPQVRKSIPISEEAISALFVVDTKWPFRHRWVRPTVYLPLQKRALIIGMMAPDNNPNLIGIYGGGFTITYVNGRKQISSSTMRFLERNHEIEVWTENNASACVGSWCDPVIHGIVPYPW